MALLFKLSVSSPAHTSNDRSLLNNKTYTKKNDLFISTEGLSPEYCQKTIMLLVSKNVHRCLKLTDLFISLIIVKTAIKNILLDNKHILYM